ncbi:ricin-type beta-trefoil lectin domain protein [Streptomyces sp. ISL-44]|uniref:RICIN domain-containing protein n=1 Tax=Streptomyces sp. ISL-44 TaxID=2819184 RepID=UPI001BEB6E55|nr:RICIN domain-containing protein [Streptomyces sp. ISL-44]MBT2545206.1 ricin-type beta-trefoil lectin domain protein [Streptomyces sp. ISL-44]
MSPQPTPSKEPGPKEPPGGLFRLANDGSRLCLAVPLRSNTAADGIVQADCGGIAEQEWYLTRETTDPSGTVYSVRNRFSGMCLSVDAARTTNDSAVTHYVCGDREGLFPDQFWKVRYDGGHRAWQLVNVQSGKCAGARPGDGANAPVLQRDCRDDPWLMWAQ